MLQIETGCITDNHSSENIMIKCGFTKEGYKKRHQCLEGKWRDRVEYGLFKEDYKNNGN